MLDAWLVPGVPNCCVGELAGAEVVGPLDGAVGSFALLDVDGPGTGSARMPSALTVTVGSSVVASSASVDSEGGYKT